MKKIKISVIAAILAMVMMVGLLPASAVTVSAEELMANDVSGVTTAGITLEVGEAWALSSSNIEPLIPAGATDLTAPYDYGYWVGSENFGAELDETYLVSVYAYEILDAVTYETIDSGYGTEAEQQALYEKWSSGALDKQYGREVTFVETGSPYFVRAEKAGTTTIVIPAYYVGLGETETTLYVTIPVTITAASSGASSPTGGAVVTTPVESEHTLANGEEVRMVTVKGNSNVYVIGNPDYIPTGASFSSTAVTAGEVYTNAAAAVQNKYGKAADFRVFEMNLTDASNKAITQLAGYINVTLPIPAGMATEEGETIRAYRLEANGKLTKLDTAVANGQVTFATNHFSTYVLVEENAMMSPKTGDNFAVMPVVLLAVAVAGVVLIKKKAIA